MRPLLLAVLAVSCTLSRANVAPKSKPTSTTIRATPLSPTQLIGKVAYSVNNDVWAFNIQTGHKQLLYKGTGAVVWSPNRQQIAFVRSNLNGSSVFVMKWDGSAQYQVSQTRHGLQFYAPRWSFDGRKLLYTKADPLIKNPIQTVGFCVVDLEGQEPDYNSDTTTGRYLNPRWGRDGKRILADYMDYSQTEFDKFAPKILFLDDKTTEDFKYDWKDFIVENQSHDGNRRAVRINYGSQNIGEWKIEEESNTRNVIWAEGDGFGVRSVCFGSDKTKVIVEGGLTLWSINTQGVAQEKTVYGIWVVKLNQQTKQSLRLLVKDAHIIDWF